MGAKDIKTIRKLLSMKRFLLLTDVDAIQSYVFSSIRMSTIVGASQIVRESEAISTDTANTVKNEKGELAVEVGVCHGGGGLFVFNDIEKARDFERQISREFKKRSVNGSLSTSGTHEFGSDSGQSFRTAREAALEELEGQKRLGRNSSESPELGWAWNCETCGANPATEAVSRKFDSVDDDQAAEIKSVWRVCPACKARYDHRKSSVDRQKLFYQDRQGEPKLKIPFNLEDLAGDSHWALVVLDGDGLGQRLREFDSPQSYQEFSNGLKSLIESALKTGLQSIQELHQQETAPALILFDGGDDIVVACPAELAFPFVDSFSRHLQYSFAHGECEWDGGKAIGFSAGVVVTRQGFPFQTAHRIADGLLRNAKTKARKNGWIEGAIDFAVITEAYGDSERILAERSIGDKRGVTMVSFTGRPYHLKSGGARSFEKLKSACRLLKQKSFPSNSLFDLRNNLNRTAIVGTKDHESSKTVEEVCSDIVEPFITNWERRVNRVPLNEATWAEVNRLLDFNSPKLNSSAEAEFPHADLADAIYLWEKCFDSSH